MEIYCVWHAGGAIISSTLVYLLAILIFNRVDITQYLFTIFIIVYLLLSSIKEK